MNYFFLYTKTTGNVVERHVNASEEFTNVPNGCEVIGPIDFADETAKEAFDHPNYYTVLNGELTPVPNIEELRAADQAPKPVPVDPRDEKIAKLELQVNTLSETVDFLLGV